MIKEIQIQIDELLLDPNNPRLMSDLNRIEKVEDKDLDNESEQERLLQNFKLRESARGDEEFTDIKDLYDSMSLIGYVPIDRIVVRKIENSDKYLVIEGNRRVATMKRILRELAHNAESGKKSEFDNHRDSFQSFNCILLNTSGKTEKEIADNITKVLGLRHHGSLKEWDPLPSAYDIYKQYRELTSDEDEFQWDNKTASNVAKKLSITLPKVRESLRTYIAFKQLDALFKVRTKHYSLIQAAVTNTSLKSHLITIDDGTFKLDEVSLQKMNKICQFEEREELENSEKIIPDPKTFSKLGRIYSLRAKHSEVLGSFVDAYLSELYERESDISVDKIMDLVTNRLKQVKWVETVMILLEKQKNNLDISNYSGTGNDKGNKDELVKTLAPILRVMDL